MPTFWRRMVENWNKKAQDNFPLKQLENISFVKKYDK